MKQPKGLVYRAEYEPDMSKMVRALRVLLESSPEKPGKLVEQKLEQQEQDKKTA